MLISENLCGNLDLENLIHLNWINSQRLLLVNYSSNEVKLARDEEKKKIILYSE